MNSYQSSLTPEQLLLSLRWRYAVKQFDPTQKIPSDLWQTLEDSLVLTPSSYGLQPWKFIVITDQKIRSQLVEHSWNQQQIIDCSHLVLFTVYKKITEDYVNHYMSYSATTRNVDPSSLDGFRQMIISNIVQNKDEKEQTHWATLQAYIALGNFMTCAALLGIDTCPMEGFIPEKYDAILDLEKRGLTTAVICPAGYRSSEDKHANMAKIRFEKKDLIEHI